MFKACGERRLNRRGIFWPSKRKEFPMTNRQRAWIVSAAVVSFVVGFLLVLNDSSAGWIFFIFGLSYLATLTRASQDWAASNLNLMRWGLMGVTVLLILLIVIIGAVFLLK
jgi:hypothetical protein